MYNFSHAEVLSPTSASRRSSLVFNVKSDTQTSWYLSICASHGFATLSYGVARVYQRSDGEAAGPLTVNMGKNGYLLEVI